MKFHNLDNTIRIDKFLVDKLKISRNKIVKLIDNNHVLVNDIKINKSNFLLKQNDIVIVSSLNLDESIDFDKKIKISELNDSSINFNLPIVYEDENCLIVNKPNDVLVYPVYENDINTLAHALKRYFLNNNNNEFGNDVRQGIIHRLDRKTTGLVIVAKNKQSYEELKSLIINNKIDREYHCLVNHHFAEKELNKKIRIQTTIGRSKNDKYRMQVNGGKSESDAITIMEPIKNIGSRYALVKNNLITGRTHQIRVHMRYINHPIVNDELYGIEKKCSSYGQYLTCTKIKFTSPFTRKNIEISIDLPDEFHEKIRLLENE